MKHERTGYTGKIAETEVLGETRPESRVEKGQYYSFETLVELAKDQQPDKNPSDPKKRFPNDLHTTIAEGLGLDDYKQLKYYTAVGSPLDHFKGVDAFFELDLGGGESAIVTLDMTTNPTKGPYKADVPFDWPSEGISYMDKEDRGNWSEKVKDVAEHVMKAMTDRVKNQGRVIRSLSEFELEESSRMAKERRDRILLKLSHHK